MLAPHHAENYSPSLRPDGARFHHPGTRSNGYFILQLNPYFQFHLRKAEPYATRYGQRYRDIKYRPTPLHRRAPSPHT